jgi:hypothetical protein
MAGSGFKKDEAAASGMLAFLIAGVIFTGSIGAILITSHKAGGPSIAQDDHKAASYGAQAKSLADTLVGSPGYSQPTGTQTGTSAPAANKDWTANPDAMIRLGLMDPSDPTLLSYAKLDNLRRAPLASSGSDGYVNYEEARHSLGLDQSGLGFHVRAWPDLGEVQRNLDAGQTFGANLSVAYLGHMQNIPDEQKLGAGTYNIRLCIVVLGYDGRPSRLGLLEPLTAVVHVADGGHPDEQAYKTATPLTGFEMQGNAIPDVDTDGDGTPDAICTYYTGLSGGGAGYTYGQATMTGNTRGWTYSYNDQVVGGCTPHPFDGRMYDGTTDNNDGRETCSDGHIVLSGSGNPPPTRQMILTMRPADSTSCGVYCPSAGGNDAGIGSATVTCSSSLVNNLKTYRLGTGTDVRNDGMTTTQLWATIKVTNSGGTLLFQQNTNAFPVAPGGSVPLAVVTPANQALCAQGNVLSLAIFDPDLRLFTTTATVNPAKNAASGGSTPPYGLIVDTYAKPYFLTGEQPRMSYSVPGASGNNKANLVLQVWDPTFATKHFQVTLPQVSGTAPLSSTDIPATLAPGNYVVRLCGYTSSAADCDKTSQTSSTPNRFLAEATENFLVTAQRPDGFRPAGSSAITGYPFKASAAAAEEVGYLSATFKHFCPYYFDGASYQPSGSMYSPMASPPAYAARCPAGTITVPAGFVGSAFPDTQGALNDGLPLLLATEPDPAHVGALRPKYLDVLVVGSDFDHVAMSREASKQAVKDWVWAGGHLVIFGSTNTTDATWLDPIFSAGITSSSTGIYTPDLDHPLLHTPYALNYAVYGKPDSYWNLDSEARTHFTDVIVDQKGGTRQALTVSDPAAFGLGRVVLTGWKPFNLLGVAGSTQDSEARHLLANMVLIGYQDLFLDYGPHIPPNVNVIPATRSAWINHPDLGPVAVSLVVYIFPQPT